MWEKLAHLEGFESQQTILNQEGSDGQGLVVSKRAGRSSGLQPIQGEQIGRPSRF